MSKTKPTFWGSVENLVPTSWPPKKVISHLFKPKAENRKFWNLKFDLKHLMAYFTYMLHFKVLVTKIGQFIENMSFLRIHLRGITIHQNRSKFYVDFKNTIFNTKYVTFDGKF